MPTVDAVLRDEANEIHPTAKITDGTSGADLNRRLAALGSNALCLSGGGIRSAAFSLGIVQALANCPRPVNPPAEGTDRSAAAKNCMLAQFHYLSTVSGGGYTGSFLSAWRSRTTFPEMWADLVGRPAGPETEPGAIRWIRSYSNYLTPKLGLVSADTRAAVALSLRNLLLNWLVILPAFCAVIVGFKIFALLSDWMTRLPDPRLQIAIGLSGIGLLVAALALITHNRPTRQTNESEGVSQNGFLAGPLLLSVLSALLLMQFLASDYVGGRLLVRCEPGHSVSALAPPDVDHTLRCGQDHLVHVHTKGTDVSDDPLQPAHSRSAHVAVGAAIGAVVYGLSWIVGRPRRRTLVDWILWAASGAVYGALLSLGAYIYIQVPDAGIWIFSGVVLHLVFGVPWVLISQAVAEGIFVGLSSYQRQSEADREWFGRSSGWLLAVAICWFAANFLAFFGIVLEPLFLEMTDPDRVKTIIPIVGTLSGLITALFGTSSILPAKGQTKGVWQSTANIVLAVAALVFTATLVIVLSYWLDQIDLGHTLVPEQFDRFDDHPEERRTTLLLLAIALVVALVVEVLASACININRFSLHALYRNRLIRAFLGASNLARRQNPFTGFDSDDNIPMHRLWSTVDRDNWRPFHVVNMALNVVSTTNLAWQERKAESFVVTPRHAGSRRLGFCESKSYAGPDGLSLGTAMAISGAAASPNMGYHSSPGITFLMTMCNVRLGWWLANPGPRGKGLYDKEGPQFAILPLVQEALGLTTDDRRFVYLSDGGHFENLGLYEMVRRRCRLILVSDAACDPDFSFDDLGNAVRKISIDLGVSIKFHKLGELKRRPLDGTDLGADHVYHAIGEIDYASADGAGENGIILYVKAGYHGVESAGIRSYAMANLDFPHQSTLNQWFTESQFESYRRLGFEIMESILDGAIADPAFAHPVTLEQISRLLRDRARQAGSPLQHAGADRSFDFEVTGGKPGAKPEQWLGKVFARLAGES